MGWLRGQPQCRCEGARVQVQLDLDTDHLPGGPHCAEWTAGDLHTSTPSTTRPSITCSLPRALFENRSRVELQILRAAGSQEPVYPWTQFPVLAQTSFRARMDTEQPELVPES